MITKRLIFFLLIVGLASTGIVYLQKQRSGPPTCDFCERKICRGTFYHMRLSWGRTRKSCCARCGIRWEKDHPGNVKEARVMDFAVGEWTPAKEAFYVEGSDFMHCNPEQILREPHGESLVKCNDRCLPSVVAFKRQEDAQSFMKDHGGRLLSYKALKEII